MGSLWLKKQDGTLVPVGSGGGGSDGYTFVQDTLPVAEAGGQTWLDTSTGNSFVWFEDADSSQWVMDGPGSPLPADDDTGWINFVLVDPWIAYGSGYPAPSYRRVGDTVSLRGLLGFTGSLPPGTFSGFAVSVGTTIDPPTPIIQPVLGFTNSGGDVPVQLRASPAGSYVIYQDTGTPGGGLNASSWVTLDGVRWIF